MNGTDDKTWSLRTHLLNQAPISGPWGRESVIGGSDRMEIGQGKNGTIPNVIWQKSVLRNDGKGWKFSRE